MRLEPRLTTWLNWKRSSKGEDIYNSGKYQSRGADIELICHNAHAWPKDLHFPQSREVHIYEGNVWHAIREITQGEPLAVWLLGGQNRQLSVDQFVLQDGRTHRTQDAHERFKAICAGLGNPELADRAFGENHAASIMAKEKNDWKPTPASLLADIEKACVEHGHGGLWNSMNYHTREVVSIDMKVCYPASFRGMGEGKPYFERFGHPTHRMTRVAINGALPKDIGTGFAEVQEWVFEATCHPVIHAWFGRHFASSRWAPTQLLAFLTESGLLKSLKVKEAIISFENQTEVWLPESRNQGCSVIGKFTQGAKADGKRLTRRLVTDRGELDYLVRDTRLSGTLVGAPMKCELGHILTYYDGSQPQFTHLRASMLAYAHIKLLSMLQRFEPDEGVRCSKICAPQARGVKAYVAPKSCDCGEVMCVLCLLEEDYLPPVAPGQWRDKGEQIFMPQEHAVYFARPNSLRSNRTLSPSTAPRHDDPLSRHRLSYLNGGGGSGKTTRAIELFRTRNPLVHPDPSSGERDAGQGRPGPDLSQLLPLEWPDGLDAQKDGTEIHSPCDHLGRGLHSGPPRSGNLPRLARGSGRPGHLLWRPGAPPPIAGEMPHD